VSRLACGLLACLMLLAVAPVSAQTVTAGVDLLFYGDNTEFDNPFREGETRLGTAGRLFVDVALNDTVTVRGGLFGNGRYGARRFAEELEPLIALTLRRGASTFIFGSLETMSTRPEVRGPDEETPHGLLPPLQHETLSFSRAHEMGLQWLVAGAAFEHDAWINWQRLNTAAHRERFDAGYRARAALGQALALHGQWHVVHEGGQQFPSGPVQDSHAWALGVEWGRSSGPRRVTLDAHAIATRHTLDRQPPAATETGVGMFARGALEHGAWRTHALWWRGWDVLKEEGDANYLVARRDGARVRTVRDYGEIGLTRHFRPAPGVHLAASARLHRVESHYEYSYRIVARVRGRHRF
jgi:hypothetical protein